MVTRTDAGLYSEEPVKVSTSGAADAEPLRLPQKVFPTLGLGFGGDIWSSDAVSQDSLWGRTQFLEPEDSTPALVQEASPCLHEDIWGTVGVTDEADEQEGVSGETTALAEENLRLAQENAWLRMQSQAWPSYGDWSRVSAWNMSTETWGCEVQPGCVVWFYGLQNAQELNGQYGVVSRWHEESGRWVVHLSNGEEKIAKAENLMVVPSGYGYQQDQYPAEATKATRRSRAKKVAGTTPLSTGKGRPHAFSFASDSTNTGSQRSLSMSSSALEHSSSEENDCSHDQTTVMMRNIPNNYTREMLLDLLKSQGFSGSYDLVYLPIDFQTEVGLGYSFINLNTPPDAERFRRHFQGFTGWRVVSEKVCEVSWSDALQGIQAHVDRYRNSPVMHDSVPDEFKPALFGKDGERLTFPAATKTIRPPRLRKFVPK